MPAVAAIWCRWEFDSQSPSCGFYYGLWFQTKERTREEPKEKIGFVGYRYESPERGDNHNYFHVQPCKSLGGRDEEVAQALSFPRRNPTWPMPAKSTLELLLCVVVSLYGMNGLRELREQVSDDPMMRSNEMLRRSIDRIHDFSV